MDTQEIRSIIGQNIILLRRHYGMSRTTLARLIGIPVNRLRRVEAAEPGAKLYDFHVARIARVFNIRVEELFRAQQPNGEQ